MIYKTSLAAANSFVQKHHRHNKKVIGHKFSLAFVVNNETLGVIIVGRPSSRILDTGKCLEVTRCCTSGKHKNICSQLYAAARRECKKLKVSELITYSRVSESAASIRASNFSCVAFVKGRQWHGRKQNEIIDKLRWAISI